MNATTTNMTPSRDTPNPRQRKAHQQYRSSKKPIGICVLLLFLLVAGLLVTSVNATTAEESFHDPIDTSPIIGIDLGTTYSTLFSY